MKKINIIITIILFPILIFGQVDNKYKFKYDIELKKILSTCSIENVDSFINNKSVICFDIEDKKNDFIPTYNVRIKNNYIDTLFNSDISNKISITLKPDTFDITISSFGYFTLNKTKIYLKPNTKLIFKANLGNSRLVGKHGLIYSLKKLTKAEINKIIEIYSSENYDKCELIKNNTCIVYTDL